MSKEENKEVKEEVVEEVAEETAEDVVEEKKEPDSDEIIEGLPIPLTPITPIFSFLLIPNPTSSRSTRSV